ncbi:MAG: hypothetical protein WAS33_10740 [Candidatus Promineifilaceae bacterium]
MKQDTAVQAGFVRLNLFGSSQALELSSDGNDTLVMSPTDVAEYWFRRPENSDQK